MEEKPKRRRSDSDLDPRFVSPPQTTTQTAPANPFSAQSAGATDTNPFQNAVRTLRTNGELCVVAFLSCHCVFPSARRETQTDSNLPETGRAGQLQAESGRVRSPRPKLEAEDLPAGGLQDASLLGQRLGLALLRHSRESQRVPGAGNTGGGTPQPPSLPFPADYQEECVQQTGQTPAAAERVDPRPAGLANQCAPPRGAPVPPGAAGLTAEGAAEAGAGHAARGLRGHVSREGALLARGIPF